MMHLGPERHFEPSKVAVKVFRGVVGFNDYPYKDMVYHEKNELSGHVAMYHYRLFLECREIDWKKALGEGRDFHDYRGFVGGCNGHNYFVEKLILQGEPVPKGHAGYVIPEFP